MVSITRVSVSNDLGHARVYVSVMGTEEEKDEVFRGLKAASHFLRRNLGPRLAMRHLPQLSFRRDDSLEQGAHVLELMNQADAVSHDGEAAEPR
jgi:ribosome-binding factor A